MNPFGIISDPHCHNWNAFSRTLGSGINSRLQNILDEMIIAADHVSMVGGTTLYVAGDLFHVRGAVSPTVSNPLIDTLTRIVAKGIDVRILTGNHDLESRDSNSLSSACETLRSIKGVEIVSSPKLFADDKVLMIPWYDSLEDIRFRIKEGVDFLAAGGHDHSEWTLIIHAPVNSVIIGIPDHGFYPKELEMFGFSRVFSGHYHNHKAFPGEVYSVGATTHQTWNDVGTKAGYLIVSELGVDHNKSAAPEFVHYDLGWDDDAAAENCKGNFVQVKMGEADDEEVTMIRDHVIGLGALGCIVQAIPVPKGTATKRTTATVKAPTVRESINEWITSNSGSAIAETQALCATILDEVESVEMA